MSHDGAAASEPGLAGPSLTEALPVPVPSTTSRRRSTTAPLPLAA